MEFRRSGGKRDFDMPKENYNQSPFVITFIVLFSSLCVSPSLSVQYNSLGFASINTNGEDV